MSLLARRATHIPQEVLSCLSWTKIHRPPNHFASITTVPVQSAPGVTVLMRSK